MTTVNEEPTYALSEKPLFDPFERELRQARAYIDLALESYDNKMPLAAGEALVKANVHMDVADRKLSLAIDESRTYRTNERDSQ